MKLALILFLITAHRLAAPPRRFRPRRFAGRAWRG
jgi:hypothetical protein